jgi:SAM-dependent methyltransferase
LSSVRPGAGNAGIGEVTFDNATFWDERYRTNIALGSGAGSRGEVLQYKRDLMQEVVDRLRPGSILDVGCGDLEVMRELRFAGAYTVIDASSFVIERNRQIRPEWDFVAGDFVALAQSGDLHADLVICLDVLIHQHDRETYRAFVRSLLAVSRRAAVMNGFAGRRPKRELSPNVAYHEPIAQTLHDLGVESMETLATYRRTALVLVETG